MNKNIQLTLLLFAITFAGFAQVGIGTTSPDASAALDITATDKGLLIPRMTTTQKTAINSPAMGLQVYDTDTKSVWAYDGTAWKESTGGTGKFIDGATPDIAYYAGKVGIGINTFSDIHQLYVKKEISTGQITTARVDATFNGTGTSPAIYAFGATAKNTGTGTADYAIASQSILENTNAGGTINIGAGSWPQIFNSGNIGYAAGVISGVYNSGTITEAVGVATEVSNDPGKQIDDAKAGAFTVYNDGNMNKASGLFLEYLGAGTITDSYAIYIDDTFNKGTTNNFAMYSLSNANSYFNGNVGVGVTAPLQKVHIGGAMRLEPQAAAPAGALGDLYVNIDGKLYFHNGTAWKEVQVAP